MKKLKTCPICRSKNVRQKHGFRKFDLPDNKVVVVKGLDWLECLDCNEGFYDSIAMKIIENTIYGKRSLKT